MEGLQDKVAVVTGGATKIGAAVARAFHREGTRVVIADINDQDGQAVAKSLGKDALFVHTDLADDAQIANCVERAVAAFGGIDFLVNLACVYIDDAINASRKDWLDSYNINVVGGVMMLKAVRPHMIQRGGGAVVNMSSGAALRGASPSHIYTAAKGGIISLTRALAGAFAKQNVRVNAIAPGFIETAMTQVLAPELKEAMLKAVPLGRPGTPDDIANAVRFLASEETSYITGNVIKVNGGMLMG